MRSPALILILLLSGCHATTLTARGGPLPVREPDFEESRDFYLLGLSGSEAVIKVAGICDLGSTIRDLRVEISPSDFIKTILTLGIYAPKTAQVWCEEGKK